MFAVLAVCTVLASVQYTMLRTITMMNGTNNDYFSSSSAATTDLDAASSACQTNPTLRRSIAVREDQYEQNKDTSYQSSRETAGWRRVADIPHYFIESSCAYHHDELWCCGGYLNNRCSSFSPVTEQWTSRPSLPEQSHHHFNSFFSLLPERDALLLFGGVANNPHRGNEKMYILDTSSAPPHAPPSPPTNSTTATNAPKSNSSVPEHHTAPQQPQQQQQEWKYIDAATTGDDPTSSSFFLGGMSSCTVHAIDGWHYCHLGTDPHYYEDTTRFYAFTPKTQQVKNLTIPPTLASHASMIADPIRQRVLMLGYRGRSPDPEFMGFSSRDIHYYDIPTNTWNQVDEPSQIDENMPALEARGFYHHSSTLYGYLAGGQNNAMMFVNDVVYKFTLSEDPTDRAIKFTRWTRLPGQPGFGAVLEEVPPGSGQLLYVGGSKSVGAYPSHECYYWDQSPDPMFAAPELERRLTNASSISIDKKETLTTTKIQQQYQPFSLKVIAATYGIHDVTSQVQKLVDEGWTDFKFYMLPDLGIWEGSQWIGGWKGHIVNKTSTGRTYRTGQQAELLTIHIEEPSGRVRMHICPVNAGCKFNFIYEETERQAYRAAFDGQYLLPISPSRSVISFPPKEIF